MIKDITNDLTSRFEKYRIVFWYDAKKEMRDTFESLDLPGVVKLEIANNEYALKYRMLREEPEQKFLVYHEGPQPDDSQNWLLDVLLANGEFRADKVGLFLSELELDLKFDGLVREHLKFFGSQKRRNSLKKLLKQNDNENNIRLKMLAVCAGIETLSEERMEDDILKGLLQELAEGKSDAEKCMECCALFPFFWQQMKDLYGYEAADPSMNDFSVELFKSSYALKLGEKAKLSENALRFLQRWKENSASKDAFRALSDRYAKILGIDQDLEKREYTELSELDFFRVIDQKIIIALTRYISERTLSPEKVEKQVAQRKKSFWYTDFSHLYSALECASSFLPQLESTPLEMQNPTEGVECYSKSWFRMDQLYRRFIYHSRMASQPTLLGNLQNQIEKNYANKFVLTLGKRFQEALDAISEWKIPSIPRQDDFFNSFVQPFLNKKNKVCVIISDALRYEIGEELQKAIQKEDRFSAELSPMLAMLPSYTQLGMAALLPHKELAFVNNESSAVLVDGMPSQSTENRTKILQATLRGQALKAEDIRSMDAEKTRDLLKANDVLYIYHNRIDASGDKKESEDKVFEAAQETVKDLVWLVKKLSSNNANNLLITADHGFLFQNNEVEESDFLDIDMEGGQILDKSRRFVLGHSLLARPGMRTFTSKQLGLTGNIQVQIPKSVLHLRVKGAGSRYVHGGASLQEVVLPVIKINKKRQSDTSTVEVAILETGPSVITTNQVTVTFYQREAVTDKIHSRSLRAGIYTEKGERIDSHELTFDSTSDNVQDREQTVCFLLGSSAKVSNGEKVILKLEERFDSTSHYAEYARRIYRIQRYFFNDFD